VTAAGASLRTDARVMGLVGFAHGLSHFFQLCIPPLFPLIREEFGASYAALGAVLAVFYAVSGVMQTVAGFLVDRVGARRILLAGLALIAAGTLAAGLVPSFGWLFVAAAVAGLGNSVFHPADLALLNGKIDPRRLGYAFSVHGITGNFGWVLAPLFVVPVAQGYGWRMALVAAGAIGLVFCAVLATQRVLAGELQRHPAGGAAKAAGGIAPLLARPVLMTFLFFFLYAVALVGFQTFSTAALTSLHGVTLVAASTALTAFLIGGAAGILAGGLLAARTQRHNLVAAIGVGVPAVLSLWIAAGGLGGLALAALMALTGFVLGSIGPSRDIIVRDIAPPEARGKVYGFVYSGLDLAGLLAPLVFGWALDHGRPDLVFVGSAVFLAAAIPTVMRMRRRGMRPVVPATASRLR
jgi:MFS family permease